MGRPVLIFALLGLAALAACATATGGAGSGGSVPAAAGEPEYLGIETRLLDGDLVSFLLTLRGVRGPADIEHYGRCAAAQYALIRGARFVRHVRTTSRQRNGIWRADAAYVISAALPAGLRTVDAEVTVEDCKRKGIPTV